VSAKPAKRNGAGTASATATAATASGPMEARAVIDSLSHAFRPDDQPRPHGQLGLPDAVRDSGPPLVLRRHDGDISFANPAFKKLSEALTAAHALASAEDLAAVIAALGQPYTEDLLLSPEGRPQYYLAWHDLVPGAAPDSPYVLSCYVPAEGAGRRLRALQDSDDRWRDLTRLVSDIVWECSSEAVITYVSPRVLDLLGYHPHDIVGRPWSFLVGDEDKLTARLSDPAQRAPFRGLKLTLVDK
jgi:PAS domain-containing protein